MTRILYVHVVPPAMRLATLAVTAGFLFAVADLCSSLFHRLRAPALFARFALPFGARR